MQLQKINENSTSPALQKILQGATVQLIEQKNFVEASRMMPKKIEMVFDEPKIFEVVKAIGAEKVLAQVEFELIKLASLMSVGGNLNKAQVSFIADSLVADYPNEAIADFKICFERGAKGLYGDIQRLDGITIGLWFKKYLEEKYEILEKQLKAERSEKIYDPVDEVLDKDRLAAWKAAIDAIPKKPHKDMDEKEIAATGKEKPLKAIYRNGYTLELVKLKDAIRKAGHQYYGNVHSFSNMSSFNFGDVDVRALNIEDAEKIYQVAKDQN